MRDSTGRSCYPQTMAWRIDPRIIVTTSGAALLLACTDRPANGDEATASTTDTTSAATTTGPATTTGDTTDTPTSTSPTTSSTGPDPSTSTTNTSTTDPVATGSTTSATDSTTDTGESTAEPPPVGCNDCDALWELDGPLIVHPQSDFAALQCLGVVHGQMTVTGDLTAQQLAPLCHLEIVEDSLTIEFNTVLTDLSSFAGLKDAESLRLWQLPALTAVSGLTSLRNVPRIEISETGATALGSVGTNYNGFQYLDLFGNPALTDVSAIVEWGFHQDPPNSITIRDHAALTDLSDLEDLFAVASSSFSFELQNAPALTSLAGLGTASNGDIALYDLPLVTDLQPLSQIQTISLHLRNIPLTSLAGLGSLKSGILWLEDMPLLTSLNGLGPLAKGSVELWRLPKLGSLEGLEKFATGNISFIDLPLVSSLAPLGGFVEADTFTIYGMPLVTSLTGLDNLGSAHSLSIGDCVNAGTSGMDGLTSLAGLGALTSATNFTVSNNAKLTSLSGVGSLSVVSQVLAVINNPKLPKAAFDALLVQVDEPFNTCFGDWGACACFEILPP